MITVPGSPRRNSLSAPVRDNKAILEDLRHPQPRSQGNIGKKSGSSCPGPNCLDCTKLHTRYLSWWSKRADSWGICCHCPIQLKFLSDLMPIGQCRDLGLKPWWPIGHCAVLKQTQPLEAAELTFRVGRWVL